MAVSDWTSPVTAVTASVSGRSDWSSTVTVSTLAEGLGHYINSGGLAVQVVRWRKTSTGKVATTMPTTATTPPPPPPPPPPDPDPPGEYTIVVPADAGYVDVTKSPYLADPTGVRDSTAALRSAFNDNDWLDSDTSHKHVDKLSARTVFLPEGTYKVSGDLSYTGSSLRIMGAGKTKTVIKLVDNATGYTSAGTPKYLLRSGTAMNVGQDNSGFANYLEHLTIDVGAGNLGVVAYRFAGANVAAMRHVLIKSSDGTKRGLRGLALESTTGPCGVFDVEIDGFSTGVYADSQAVNDIVFTGLTLRNQLSQGVLNTGKSLAFEDLTTVNVPKVINCTDASAAVMIDGATLGGSGGQPAITTTGQGYAWMRDVTASGFSNIVTQAGTAKFVGGTAITEWATHNFRRGNSGVAWASSGNVYVNLNLPHPRAPEYHNTNLAEWANVRDFGAVSGGTGNDSAAIQAAIDSGAKVVYFPYGSYTIGSDVFVRGNVRKIDFCFSVLDAAGGGITVNSVTDGVVELANVSQTGIVVTQNGSSDLVYRDCGARTGYTSTTGIPGTATIDTGASATGDIYAENFGARGNLQVAKPINVFLRQWNRERVPMNISGGAKVWCFGDNVELHSNYGSANINVSGSSQLEMIGGAYDVLNYAGAYPTSGRAVLAATNSQVSIVQASAQRSGSIGHWVSDTVSGALVGDVNSSQVTQSVTGSSNNRVVVSYVSP